MSRRSRSGNGPKTLIDVALRSRIEELDVSNSGRLHPESRPAVATVNNLTPTVPPAAALSMARSPSIFRFGIWAENRVDGGALFRVNLPLLKAGRVTVLAVRAVRARTLLAGTALAMQLLPPGNACYPLGIACVSADA